MRKVAMRGLAAHKVRFSLTVLSVVLGTAFIAASFVFTQMLGRSFDDVVELTTDGVAVQVQPTDEVGAGVPLSLVDELRDLDGVRAVEPTTQGPVTLVGGDGEAVSSGGAPSLGYGFFLGDDAVSTNGTLAEGRAPERAGEIVLNDSAADSADLQVGDTTTVVPQSGEPVQVELVGVVEQAGGGLGGFVGVGFSPDQAVDLFTDGTNASDLLVAADAGVDEEVLRDRVAAAVPDGLRARTGAELREESKTEFQTALTFINSFLTAFGLIALLVGSFIIANTFSMVVAQRAREMALLRAVGASRGQVTRSVVVEAFVVGVAGSTIGLAAGFGLAKLLTVILSAVGSGIPISGQSLTASSVGVTMAVGVAITVLAALVPARRAGGVAPVEAMRGEFATPSSSHAARVLLGLTALALGVFATWVGVTTTSQIWLGAGFLGVGTTVVLMSPLVAPVVFRVLAPLLARPFGSIGRMAHGNASRNPRRTAATALALALGLTLVTVFSIIGASAKASLEQLASAGAKWDYVLSGPSGPQGGAVPRGAVDDVAAVDGVGVAVALTLVPALVDGQASFGFAAGPGLDRAIELDMAEGEQTVAEGTVLLNREDAAGRGPGDTFTVAVPGRAELDLTVAGVYESDLLSGWLVDQTTADALVAPQQQSVFQVFVVAADGAAPGPLRAGLEDALAPYVTVTVSDVEQFTDTLSSQVDIMLGILYGLLALAVVISVLGIVNTLGLSVVERRREIGVLRAVGMQRGQVRTAIYVESVLISVYGAILGLVVGLVFGYLFARSLADDGLDITVVPWGQALAFLVVAAVVGVLAALWPGHRAARTRPLEAIASQ